MNILFLGGAKRVQMGHYFLQACRELGLENSRLFSYELDTLVPIAEIATVIRGRYWSAPDVLEDIHQVVQQNAIQAIIPFVDGAVAVAARYAAKYDDAFVPAGSAEISELMFDKIQASQMFAKAGIEAPRPWPECGLPAIAKPRYGSASKGIRVLNSPLDLTDFDTTQYHIQEYIGNRQEYTVDCYVDCLNGQSTYIVPRIRLEVEGGEVTRTRTVDDNDIVNFTRWVLSKLDLRGAVTVQLMRDLDHFGRMLIMEVNPRLGGGATCSVAAGANLPMAILQNALGRNAKARQWAANTEVARYRMDAVFRK